MMKTIVKTLTATCFITVALSGSALAEAPMEPPRFQPVEMWTCDYNKGKGPKDLARVNARWNKWMDENSSSPYAAWLLTPQFVSADIEFDVAWLGVWQDGAGMGAATDVWVREGGAMSAEFDKVISCDSHATAASVNIRRVPRDKPPQTSVVMFSSCTMAEGKLPEDGFAAHTQWAKYLEANNSRASLWVFYPGMGSGELDFDYYIVTANPDYKSVGADFELLTNGGGYLKAREVAGGIVTCDSPRAYDAELVRYSL